MKEPEMLQTIVTHHCLSYEIAFHVVKRKLKIDHSHIHNRGKML